MESQNSQIWDVTQDILNAVHDINVLSVNVIEKDRVTSVWFCFNRGSRVRIDYPLPLLAALNAQLHECREWGKKTTGSMTFFNRRAN